MTRITLADFEQRYREDPDPWSYETSGYERAKYEHTAEACGQGPFSCALELGCSIGVFTARLAPRCRRLIAVDGSSTALSLARKRVRRLPQVELVCGRIPDAIPRERPDLVVASEILYYLDRDELSQTLRRLDQVMLPGARLVAVHWRAPGPERPLSAADVHRDCSDRPWLAHVAGASRSEYLLDVWERR